MAQGMASETMNHVNKYTQGYVTIPVGRGYSPRLFKTALKLRAPHSHCVPWRLFTPHGELAKPDLDA